MQQPEYGIYRFDNIEVDPARGCLRRDGQEHYLRQKTFQVLLFLLERNNRLVTKEELMESVWKGTAVTDDVLVQCVMDIRKAIGDDSRNPRFVRTIPKVGYRFIGSVEAPGPAGLATLEKEEITSIDFEIEEEQDAADLISISAFPGADKALPAPQAARKLPRWFPLATALALLLVAATVLLPGIRGRLFRRSLSEPTLPQLAGKKPMAVMAFENQSSDPALDWMRDGLADMFITDLSRSPKLTVLSRQQLHMLLDRVGHHSADAIRLQEALEVAQKSRAEAFLMGSYTKFGDKLRIGVQLYDARSGQLLKDESLTVDRPGEMLTQVDLLSLKLSSFWGGGPAKTEKAGLGEVMTDNLEAYRNYSLGMEKAQGLRSTEAIALFQKAVELDPQFAMAYARIGYTYAVPWGRPKEGRPYLEKAFQLSARLTDKDRLSIAAWYAIANRDYPGAIKQFREFISRYPMETEAYWRLGGLLTREDRNDEAIEVLQQGLLVDPEEPETYNKLGGCYSAVGRHKEAIATYQHYVALAPREPNAHDSLGLGYQWAGLYPQAVEEYDEALALDPRFEIAIAHLANVHFQMGHYREAIRLNQRYIEIAPSPFEQSRGYANLAWIRWRQANLDEAAVAATESSRLSKGWDPVSVVIAAERGDLKTAEELSKLLVATDPPFSDRGSRVTLRDVLYSRGHVTLKQGHADNAIELFQETLRHLPPTWDIDSHESCLAEAYLELGRFDEAIAEYQRILRLNPNYPLAHYHLGLAYEGKGQSSQARSEFKHFLEVWKDADPEIPEVIAAKQRLAS